MKQPEHARWRLPLVEAILITGFVLGLFAYWFGVADRYAIFLYGHVAVGIPGAQPFDELTSSRYWMAGLVAAGAVMVLYVTANWLRGRVAARRNRHFTPADWWWVWLLCAIPLSTGIVAITMNLNWPTLPSALAVACVVATLLGLIVALLPGQWAAERPLDLAWLAVDGAGLMPAFLLLRVVELPDRGLSIDRATAWIIALGGLVLGLAWLAGMSALRLWRQKEIPSAGALFAAGLGLTYLLLPLVHHLLATPPAYRYISTASNFFAFNVGLQIVALGVAAVMVVGVTALRRRLSRRRRMSQ